MSDFGILGDGTDERTKLLQAVNYAMANDLTLVFDKLVYFSGGSITCTGRVRWRGIHGGGLFALAGTTMYIRGDNSRIVDLTANWNGKAGTPFFVQSSRTYIKDCEIYGSGGHGIGFDGQNPAYPCVGSAAIDNNIHDISAVGIATNGAKRLKIQGNQIANVDLEAITLDNTSGDPERGFHTVMGNTADTICRVGGVGAIGIDATKRSVVSGNILTNSVTRPGICFQNNTGDTTENTISDNVIDTCSGHAILLYGNASGYRARNNTIAGNKISNYTGDPISVAEIESTYNYVAYVYDNGGTTNLGGIGNWAPLILSKPIAPTNVKITQEPERIHIDAGGSAADVSMVISAKGNENISFSAYGAVQGRFLPVQDAVNFVDFSGDTTGGGGPIVQAGGADGAIALKVASKGNRPVVLRAYEATQVRILPVQNAVDFIDLSGDTLNGSGPIIQAGGASVNTRLRIASKLDARIELWAYDAIQARILPVQNAVSFIDISGDVADGGGPIVQAGGPGAHIDLRLKAKDGYIRFGNFTPAAGLVCNGSITIRDDDGNLQKLMTAA